MAKARDLADFVAPRDPANVAAVEEWLDAVSARLVGSRHARNEVLAELRDGLYEGVDAHRAEGATVDQAAATAVAEFGPPALVAKAFAPELAARQARRTALTLVLTGPLVGVLWLIAVTNSHILTQPPRPEPPWLWPGIPIGLRVTLAVVGAAVAIGVPSGLAAVATTGRWSYTLRTSARFAPTAAATIGVAGIAADLILLAALAGVLVIAPPGFVWTPLVIAATASGVRLALNMVATRQLLATRVALP